jgi:hypothetical protein
MFRLSVKLYCADPEKVAVRDVVPIFHRWIQQKLAPDVLVDVTDYSHVERGPGVLLIGHTADYAVDLGEGRPGLLFRHKRGIEGELAERVRGLFLEAIRAAARLSDEAKIAFRTDEWLFAVNDRLRAPNTPETQAALQPLLEALLEGLLAPAALGFERDPDPRAAFALRIRAPFAPPLATLLDRAEAAR